MLRHFRLWQERRHPCPSLYHPTESLVQQQGNEEDAGGKKSAESPAGKAEKTYVTPGGIEEEEKVIVLQVM